MVAHIFELELYLVKISEMERALPGAERDQPASWVIVLVARFLF
jgi:hypothetical protein